MSRPDLLRRQVIDAIEKNDDAVLGLVIGACDVVAQVLSTKARENGFDPAAFVSTIVAVNENTHDLETDIGRRSS